eukprot:1567056-Pyramimonas_sp.AAC.1
MCMQTASAITSGLHPVLRRLPDDVETQPADSAGARGSSDPAPCRRPPPLARRATGRPPR